MNADRLLAHFEKISEAPDAVDRLRRFVLDLAVRGNLVEQDSREGTAQELLALHGVRMGETGETPPFPVPQSWTWLAIGDVCSKTGSGSTPRGGKAAYKSSGTPFLRSQNVHDDGLKLDDVAFIDAATHHRMTGTAVQPDDLLLNITGGSMGRCCRVPSTFVEGNVSQHVAILRAAIPGTQAFLHKCIVSAFFQTLIFDEQTGAGRGGLPKNKMDRLPIPLPPLAEQHRIVEKVDELMLLCDRLEASQAERETRRNRLVVSSLNRIGNPSGSEPKEFKKDAGFHLRNLNRLSSKPEHIKELRKAILNLAVRGKLVPQDQREGTAEEFPMPVQPLDHPAGDSRHHLQLPESWKQTTLGAISTRIHYGYTASANPQCLDVRMLRITDIQDNRVEWNSVPGCEIDQEDTQKYRLHTNDILVARTGGTIGKTFLVEECPVVAVFASYLIRVQPLPEMNARYVKVFMESPLYWDQLHEGSRGGGQPNVNGKTLSAMVVPLPPLAEQKRIVAKVDELMAICDQLEKQLESQQKDSRRLLEALLHEALEGVG